MCECKQSCVQIQSIAIELDKKQKSNYSIKILIEKLREKVGK